MPASVRSLPPKRRKLRKYVLAKSDCAHPPRPLPDLVPRLIYAYEMTPAVSVSPPLECTEQGLTICSLISRITELAPSVP